MAAGNTLLLFVGGALLTLWHVVVLDKTDKKTLQWCQMTSLVTMVLLVGTVLFARRY